MVERSSGSAWHGKAWRGRAGLGGAWHGMARFLAGLALSVVTLNDQNKVQLLARRQMWNDAERLKPPNGGRKRESRKG